MKRYQRTTMICVLSAAVAMTYGVVGQAQTTAPAPAGNAAARDIAVAVKGQQSLMLDGAAPSRIAIGDPEVADVKILPASGKRAGSLLLYGKKAGTTQLQIWTGNSPTPQIWNVRVAGSVQAALASRGMQGGPNVDIAGDKAVLSGNAETPLAQIAAAQAAAAAVGDKNVVDVSTAGAGGVVQVEVKVVEVSRSVMKQAGINFAASNGPWASTSATAPSGLGAPPGFTPGGIIASGFSLFYDSNNFSARLRLLQSNGMARVLAEPTLVALTGQSASFLAGGELPIPEAGGLGTTTVTFKPFGIGLTVTPTVLSRDRISLKVAPEASELDYSNGIAINTSADTSTIIPALRTRRADTTVELGDGESFVISGLVSRQTKAMVNKVPMLGDLPIIGAFFRSVDYSQEDTELVIVVTPRLVRPIARGVTLPLPGGRQEAADSTFNAWGYYLMGPVGGQQMPGFSR